MTIHRVWPGPTGSGYTLRFGSRLIQSEYRRYAEVARKLAKQQQGSNGFMWAQLAALWDKVADRMAAKERSCLRRAASGKRVSRFGRESAAVGGEAVNQTPTIAALCAAVSEPTLDLIGSIRAASPSPDTPTPPGERTS